MNEINNQNIINYTKYYQILQHLGINQEVSLAELIIIQTEMVNESSRALNKPSFDELDKKTKMICEAVDLLME